MRCEDEAGLSEREQGREVRTHQGHVAQEYFRGRNFGIKDGGHVLLSFCRGAQTLERDCSEYGITLILTQTNLNLNQT